MFTGGRFLRNWLGDGQMKGWRGVWALSGVAVDSGAALAGLRVSGVGDQFSGSRG